MAQELPQPLDATSIDQKCKAGHEEDFSRRANLAFLIKSFGIGFIALLVPIILPVVGGNQGNSISYYYHLAETRDLFVGLLWALGLFLVLFQGLSRWENLLLSAAGVFLILVAMVPTGSEQCTESATFSWHAFFAIAFFACLFVVALVFAKKRLDYILWLPLRARFERAYTIAGCAMVGLPLLAWGLHLLDQDDCNRAIYWVEATAIFAFSLYWFTKTIEYKRLLGLSWRKIAVSIME